VGLGVDPTAANEAIQSYLSSQPLTPSQQGEVNLAIQALGAPPNPPGPVGVTPAPVVSPPSAPPPGGNTGSVMASNPPTGFAVTSKTATSVGLKWNAAKNATHYTVAYDTVSGSQKNKQTVNGTSVTIGNLRPDTAYYFEVWADPTKTGGAHAGPILGHTAKQGGTGPAKTYTVKPGDSLSGIAAKLHYPGGWQALYAKNKGVIGSNPNLIKPGEVLSL
jgi:LysM repeat protein